MFAILENGSVETMLRYRLRFSTGRAFAIPTGQSKTRMTVMTLRSCSRTFISRATMSITESLLVLGRLLARANQSLGPERRQRPSSELRGSPAPAYSRPSRAARLLASESTPRGDILALQPVHRCQDLARIRRWSAAEATILYV